MKTQVLLELANRWERDAKEPEMQNGAEDAKIPNAEAHGLRQGKRGCANSLRLLIKLLG